MHKSDFLLFLTCLCCPWMCPVLCSRGRETPSAPLGLVPLRGGTVLPCGSAESMENHAFPCLVSHLWHICFANIGCGSAESTENHVFPCLVSHLWHIYFANIGCGSAESTENHAFPCLVSHLSLYLHHVVTLFESRCSGSRAGRGRAGMSGGSGVCRSGHPA